MVNIVMKAPTTALGTLFQSYDSIVVFDLETTGLDPQEDQIIQLAFSKLNLNSGNLKQLNVNTLVHLYGGHTISGEAYAINHISESRLRTHGISINGVIDQLVLLTKDERCLFVGHNVAFDISFLFFALKYCGKGEYCRKIDVLDTLTVFKDRHPYPHKLSDAISVYGLSTIVKNSHNAMDDTQALIQVLISMESEKPDLIKYVNLIGYNPKYPPKYQIPGYTYVPQPYDVGIPLYIQYPSRASLICPDCHSAVSAKEDYCPHCGCPINFILENGSTVPATKADIFAGASIFHLKLGDGTIVSSEQDTITIDCDNGNIVLSIADFFRNCIFSDKEIRDYFLKEYNMQIRNIGPRNYNIGCEYDEENDQYVDCQDFDDVGPAEESYEYYFGDDEVLDDGELY